MLAQFQDDIKHKMVWLILLTTVLKYCVGSDKMPRKKPNVKLKETLPVVTFLQDGASLVSVPSPEANSQLPTSRQLELCKDNVKPHEQR